MAIKTTLAELEEIQAAITASLLGQKVMIDGKAIERPDINALYAAQEILRKRYNAEQGTGGMCINVGIMRRN